MRISKNHFDVYDIKLRSIVNGRLSSMRKIGDVPDANRRGQPAHKHGNCPTLEGYHIVCPGGVVGEYYPCKPDVFAMTYEIVT